jgi:hypothetical protein
VVVTPAAAERWRDPAERARLGAFFALSAPGLTEVEQWRALGKALADLQQGIAAAGITPA